MNTKHTPGPWRVAKWERDCVDGFEYIITDTRGHGIVELCQKGHNEKALANARLIAAAPETAAERDRLREINRQLLAACKVIADGWECECVDGQPEAHCGVCLARAAIAAAEGEPCPSST